MLSHFKSKKNLFKSIIKTLHTRRLFHIPPIHIKKAAHTRRTAFGDGNSKQESNQGPQSPFQGQRNLLMKEDFFKTQTRA